MEIPAQTVREAMEWYPRIPISLAVSRYVLWQKIGEEGLSLVPGASWGGLHEEDLGNMVTELIQATMAMDRSGIELSITADGWPVDYTHWTLTIRGIGCQDSPKPRKTIRPARPCGGER